MSGESEGWTQRSLAPGATATDPATAYLEHLGPGSRRTMREALTKLADWSSSGRSSAHDFPWHRLRIEQTTELRARLAATLAPATANKHLAALRGVLKQCWRMGLMSAEDYQRAIDLPPVRGEARRRRAPPLSDEDLQRIAAVCAQDSSPAGARDDALLVLLYGAQLRRAEAVALDLAAYDPATGELSIPGSGGGAPTAQPRRVVTSPYARRALKRWIDVRGSEPGPLFYPVNKGGRIEPRRLSEQAIYIACRKRAAEAGLPPTSPEDLRRSETRPESRDRRDAPVPPTSHASLDNRSIG